MSKVIPFLTFDGRAAEAVELYTSLVRNSKIHSIDRWGPGGPVPEGQVINAHFELDGQPFRAMDVPNGFPQGEAFSVFVETADQAETDHLWDALTAHGGEEQPCGWLKDRFGFSWQIIPARLGELMSEPHSPGKQAAIDAMLKMKKIIIADLDAAHAGG